MGTSNSKLLIIKADFVLFKQNKSDIQGAVNSVHICEVDKAHEIKKTTIFYPSYNPTLQSKVKKDHLKEIDSMEVTWNCIANEEANNLLRESVEDAGIIITPDKVTMNLIKNFVINENIQFIIHE